MRRFSCCKVPSALSRVHAAPSPTLQCRLLFSTTFGRLSSSSSITDPPVLLSESQVESYNKNGYLIIDDVVPEDQLKFLGSAVREAARRRGVRFVPESDKQHKPGNVEFEATLHEAMPQGERHRLDPNGQHEATFERREKRIKIKCRNRKEMERAYQKIKRMREQYAQYKGVELAPKAPGNFAKPDATEGYIKSDPIAAAEHERQQAEFAEKERQAQREIEEKQQQQQQNFVKVKPQSRQETDSQGFSHNADDDVDVHAFDREKARKTFDEYRNSGKMEKDIRKGSHLDEAFAHVYNGAQTWMQVWPKDPCLRDAVFNKKAATPAMAFCARASIASVVGSVAAQLAGVMTTRLYTDTIVQRTPFCNPLPFHHDASGLNYRDPRGLVATVVLGGSEMPFDEHHGGYAVLPGSHEVVRRITNDCRDMTAFVRPASWEVGEALRAHPQLLGIQPRVLGHIRPGSLVVFSNMLVYSNGPNMCVGASEECRRLLFSNAFKEALKVQSKPALDDGVGEAPRAPKAELFLEAAPITYSMSIMPDGVVFDGVRNTWMSKDSHGPLFKAEAGQPLRDPALFPVLYSEIPDTL